VTINAVKVTGPGNLPYNDNRGPRRLWSGRPEFAEASKIIDSQMASLFFRQEVSEDRTLYSEPDSQHFQEKPIDQDLRVAEPRNGISAILAFSIKSHGPFQMVVITKRA